MGGGGKSPVRTLSFAQARRSWGRWVSLTAAGCCYQWWFPGGLSYLSPSSPRCFLAPAGF
ncbi:rCG31133 [Rattus norvegicus]|uniref:RCG31133 n=1 Tax=Rattus norvegicus TaxID=10116 RepID=A6IUJ2_RAT|nr:rCG31133 [Rattus norvegicus]